MAREQKTVIFACVSTPTESQSQLPSSTKVKVRPQPAFGLYVPSDIADAATIQFDEETEAIELKQKFYINQIFPYMPRKHIGQMLAKEYERLQRWELGRKGVSKGVRWTVEKKVKSYVRGYTRKEGGKFTHEEAKSVMRSWKDGSKMPDIEFFQ